MMGVGVKRALGLYRSCAPRQRLVAFAVTLSALLSGIAAPRVHAQTTWGVEVSPTTLSIDEGESLTYRLRLTEPPLADGWWVVLRVNGSIRYDGHYRGISWVPSVGWEFNRDNWDTWREVRVTALQDEDGLDGSVTFTHDVWDENADCPVKGESPVTVRVIDDDDDRGSLPTLSIADASVAEGGTAEFVVTLTPASTETVTVNFETADGTAKAGSDYTQTSATLTFTAGQPTKTISVSTVDDDAQESDERFTVTLRSPDGATLDDHTGEGTIRDNDDGGGRTPELSIGDAAVQEGGTAQFEVTLRPASEQTVTVNFETADGTAKAGSDYTETSGTLTFTAGQPTKTISVSTVDDDAQESDERFMVTLRNPDGATLDDHTGEGTIRDNDDGGGGSLPTLSVGDAAVVEGDTATFRVTLSAASENVVTVSYKTKDGTAVAGSDYTAMAGTLRFEPGETTKTLRVPTVDDDTPEETEAFTVELSAPSGATVADGTGTGTISDDDGGSRSLPTLSIGDAAPVPEGRTAKFRVTLRRESGEPVTVAYRTVDGTAVAGSDYTTTSGTLRFEPGDTTKTIRIPTMDDDTPEETEAFTVELSAPSGATVADGTGTGTISDDDGGSRSLPTLSIGDAAPVPEGRTAKFRVTLRRESGEPVTVAYRTVDGTAVAGSDYTTTSGTLRFEPGETTRAVAVATLIDQLMEGAEQFTVELSDPVGTTLADDTGVGTITDDVERRIGLVNQTVLPEIGRTLAFSAVRCRSDQAFSDAAQGRAEEPVGRLSLSLAPTSDGWAAAGTEPLTLEQALGDSSFLMPSKEEEGGAGRFAAWGCGDYRNLAGGGEDGVVAWNGEVFSVHLGADVRLGSDVLAGLSVSRSRGSFDYYAGGRDAGGGAYELQLTGVHPYLGWSVSSDLDVWGTVGHSWGEIRIVDDLAGDPRTSEAMLDSGAVGVSGRLLARGTTSVKLKGEGGAGAARRRGRRGDVRGGDGRHAAAAAEHRGQP